MNILLIEPDIVLNRIYIEALKRKSHNATAAYGAEDALLKLDEATKDLIVMEVQLANHNGIELIYEFRSYPEWQDIPLILHTVLNRSSLSLSDSTVKDLNIVDILYKPKTSLDQLLNSVDNLTKSV
ncbi:response regulator [Candidatus Saccharibacteria bacterium]|nr:response regulator [Candidatus Saccharibacteria bacterium]